MSNVFINIVDIENFYDDALENFYAKIENVGWDTLFQARFSGGDFVEEINRKNDNLI